MLILITVKIQNRRNSITKVWEFLVTVRNELAFSPGAISGTKIKDSVTIALKALKRFKINQIPENHLDRALDIFPLAKIHNIGEQILSLWELQMKLNQDIRTFNYRINILQASLPPGSDDVRVAMSEAHDFMIFAKFANEMQLERKLTKFSIYSSGVRNDSGFIEGTQTLDNLKTAYSIQLELRKPRYGVNPNVSSPIALSKTTKRIIEEWYWHENLYMSQAELVC